MESFPYHANGLYVLRRARNADTKQAITGGSGSITWYPDDSAVPLAGSPQPVAVTWNAGENRYESPISADFETTLGQIVRGEVTIDSGADRFTDVFFRRVRAPSSSGPTP
jgi:hypothetical protein